MTARSGFARVNPPESMVTLLERQDPRNPFATWPYAMARGRLGESVVLVGDGSTGPLALGFERTGWMRRVLEIPSIPVTSGDSEFWKRLYQVAATRGLTRIELNSYGAIGARLPSDLEFQRRWTRMEHVLDLGRGDLLAACHRTHRQRIRQAIKAGAVVEWRRDPTALAEHARLITASVERRHGATRVTPSVATSLHEELIGTGSGEIAQVRLGGEVVASTLVLRAADGGYLHSSGSSAEGKSVGAHHFMVIEIAGRLRDEGRSVLNLGGTRGDEVGLRAFKNHFGAEAIEAEAGTIDTDRLAARLGAAASAVLSRLRRAGGA